MTLPRLGVEEREVLGTHLELGGGAISSSAPRRVRGLLLVVEAEAK